MSFRRFSGYLVSPYGEIRREKDGKLIKPYVHKSRGILYLRVNLKGKKYLVHNLVAKVWIGEKPPGCQTDHKDTNTFNNADTNLAYIPRSANHAKRRAYRRWRENEICKTFA